MNRRFITHNIKKLRHDRINALSIQQHKIKEKPKSQRPKLQIILKTRKSEARRFAKKLNKFFNETQEFKDERNMV